jgi:hypothetical protein
MPPTYFTIGNDTIVASAGDKSQVPLERGSSIFSGLAKVETFIMNPRWSVTLYQLVDVQCARSC